ncbi:MAG: Cytochrome oxidase biosis protein Sco1/SenC/PrrC, putative copper metallochaperone [Gammaproteobacteria bacterium]|nr:Cytochrome oxidase biosis protein Sco1/SenC/PrrC, putative copper metallochaperone [Gammaproteobacteria bacterium]
MIRRISDRVTTFAVATGLALAAANALAADTPMPPAMADDGGARGEHHTHATNQVTVSTAQYAVPAVTLVRQDGQGVSLPSEMNDGRPVVLNFIFTTCGSICPLMSQVFGQFQRKLGADSEHVHLMSISTDPEEDSPARLRKYAQVYGARAGWNHYTGTLEASQSAQRAFGVYRGDKMSHTPVTLLRLAPGQPWLRIDGFVTPDELLQHYHQMLAVR